MKEQDQDATFKQKRKWQIALRRYVLEEKPSPYYAPYFGLPIPLFRKWIESQFSHPLTWDNFGSSWQFDHVLPLSYFDFESTNDMRLCWNFINIRVSVLEGRSKAEVYPDVLTAKAYFEKVYQQTGYAAADSMVKKIVALENGIANAVKDLSSFIDGNRDVLKHLEAFTEDDFERVNSGLSVDDIVAEKQLMARFGA